MFGETSSLSFPIYHIKSSAVAEIKKLNIENEYGIKNLLTLIHLAFSLHILFIISYHFYIKITLYDKT